MADDRDTIQSRFFHVETERQPGDRNWRGYGFDINPPVFLIAGGIIVLFIILSLAFPDAASDLYGDARENVSSWFNWLFILGANAFIIFMVYLAMSKYGTIRLGGVDGEKEFSDISWIAMLFSAGMGIGLMFFGVAEPVYHFLDPHLGAPAGTESSAEVALAVSLFHWGFHPWAIYALVGLGLAFFSFNRGLPLTFRSVFWPLLGERIYGWWGHVIDIFTVFATLFGLVTSLGLGALQINRGLEFVGNEVDMFPAIPFGTTTQIVLILIITAIATVSVALGLEKGIRRLSNLNMTLMFVLLLSVFVLGPSLFILSYMTQGIGGYLSNIFELSFFGGSIDQGYFSGSPSYQGAGDTFLVDWTVFYWAWWISWSPFVGMFIARISRGRTVREFVSGVLVIPVLFTVAWFATMGGTALNIELEHVPSVTELGGAGAVAEEGLWADLWAGPISSEILELGFAEDTAMFAMFGEMPGTVFLSLLAILLVTTFFVTSSDSGSLVLEHLSTGGKHQTPVTGRVFWASAEGLVAIALLVAGGEDAIAALQAAAITAGLPLVLILIFMIWALLAGLREELRIMNSDEFQAHVEELRHDDEYVVETDRGDVVTDIRDTDTRPPAD